MNLFTPYHVKLITSCYPPTSALLTAGPDYSPNSHELSRLTYYASNHPGKLSKIGGELERRLRTECQKAKSGNIRSRASLLISLAILRSLATECRRDIALLSPPLMASVDAALKCTPSDLEVVARAASVFTAWTTYTNGQQIGADSGMTNDYLSVLSQFSMLGCLTSSDQETQNRTRLIGLAALTAALNSEALYNDIGHFGSQVSIILRPIITVILETSISTLDVQAVAVKDTPGSPYLAEFRTRPALERRAASVHVHVDGDKGPATFEVSDACLHAFFSLLGHTNGAQLGYVMQSSFDNLDSIQGWLKPEHCCWYAQKAAEWAQYQYRYVVPTWLIERLISQQDLKEVSSLTKSFIAMATSVFSSPTPLINLSSSDVMSNLLSLLLRRISVSSDDSALPALVECISSLGRHVYYSDQIQDLAGEIINRLLVVEMQGALTHDTQESDKSRSSAICCLLDGLVGLVRSANANDGTAIPDESAKKMTSLEHTSKSFRQSLEASRKERTAEERASRRTRVPPDIWQDTLSLICDHDKFVRRKSSDALIYYITTEMPKPGESTDVEGLSHLQRLAEGGFRRMNHVFPNAGDSVTHFLNNVHAYIYILATSPVLGLNSVSGAPTREPDSVSQSDREENQSDSSTPLQSSQRRSPHHGPRARKQSLLLKLVERTPLLYTASAQATEEDYALLLKVLTIIQIQVPMRGLLTGVPMLVALDETTSRFDQFDSNLFQRSIAMKTVIAHVWLTIGQVWMIHELVALAEQSISKLLSMPHPGTTVAPGELTGFGLQTHEALELLTSCQAVQDAFGMDREGFMRRFGSKWSPDLALRDFENSAGLEIAFRGGGMSPLLKISPALMHIENISLQSLARSTRGLGVTDLREALEGRSSMSNPALVPRAPSISTLDHTSSMIGGDVGLRLTQTRSRSRTKKRSVINGASEVRDVLSRLGISKQNSNLLKNTFPVIQKANP